MGFGMDHGAWARGHWSDRRYARNLIGWGSMVVALGLLALFVPGPAFPLVFFVLGIALVVIGIVLYRLSPPEDQDDE